MLTFYVIFCTFKNLNTVYGFYTYIFYILIFLSHETWHFIFKTQLQISPSTFLKLGLMMSNWLSRNMWLFFFSRLRKNWKNLLLAASCPSALTGRILYEIWYFSILRKSVPKIQVCLKSDKNDRATLHVDVYTAMITSLWILATLRNVSDTIYRGSRNVFYVE